MNLVNVPTFSRYLKKILSRIRQMIKQIQYLFRGGIICLLNEDMKCALNGKVSGLEIQRCGFWAALLPATCITLASG